MTLSTSPTIRHPQEDDLSDILASHTATLERGQLDWPMTADDLLKIDITHSFLVEQRKQIMGYLLTFDILTETDTRRFFLQEQGEIFLQQLFAHRLKAAVGLINVLPAAQRVGHGTRLYEQFLTNNQVYDLRFITTRRVGSVLFHQHTLPVEKVGNFEGGEAEVYGVILKNHAAAKSCLEAIRMNLRPGGAATHS